MPFAHATSVYQHLLEVKKRYGTGFFVLMDPDRCSQKSAEEQAKLCEDAGVDALLVGSSLIMGNGF